MELKAPEQFIKNVEEFHKNAETGLEMIALDGSS